MIRKAMVFSSITKMRDAFNRFKDEYPDNMYFQSDFRAITPNVEIFFLCPDQINSRLRGCTFHEVIVTEKMWLTQDEINNLQMCVVPTGGSFRSLK